MGISSTRILVEGDEALVKAFLLPHLETSMLLFGNLQARGLAYHGNRNEGVYAGAFEGKEMIGVVAHYWNQNLLLQAPTHLAALIRKVVIASGRPVEGLIGPANQVQKAKEILDWTSSMIRHDEVEKLYRLKLSELILPEILAAGEVRGRLAIEDDIDLLAKWRVAYLAEIVSAPETPALIQSSRQAIERQIAENLRWVIEHKGQVVATSSFNATVQDATGEGIVQVGGVWTLPPLRSQGFGRSVVAASLDHARKNGAGKAILFTGEDNFPAQKAYSALGFEHIGVYQMVFPHNSMAS